MKKRSPRKLTVNRETLQNLNETEQRQPNGGSAVCTSIPCFYDTQCGPSCTCW
jgi:hypothetical protein